MLQPNTVTKAIRVGHHRGKSRIWIQGAWLVPFGFKRGGCWSVEYGAGTVTITATTEGRKISGKGDVPVLDLNTRELGEVFPGGTVVETITSYGKILIRQ